MAGPMARLLGPFEERIGHLEHVVHAMQGQIDKLMQRDLGPLDGRMQAVEQKLVTKADIVHCDALQGLLSRLEAQIGCVQEALNVQPGVQQGISEAGSDGCSEPDDAEPIPNVVINLVVAYGQADTKMAENAGKGRPDGEITLEARQLERIGAVKKRAYEQLTFWHRFCDLGSDAEEPLLAPLENCQFFARINGADGQQKPLKDRHRIVDCKLEDGAELVLVPINKRQVIPAQQYNNSDQSAIPTTPLTLIVVHNTGRVDVETTTSETLKCVKQRAHEQLSMWYRFCSLGEDDESEQSLPPLEQCQLHSPNKGDGLVPSRPLSDEKRCVVECGLANGDQLELRSV